MPLSNTNYLSSAAVGNVVENWIVQLGFYNGDAQGEGEGGWDAVLQADGSANLLTAGVNDSTTTIPVDDGTVFQAGDYLKIESEIVKVVSISTNDLTVVRTQMSTSTEAHENNDAIYWNNFLPVAFGDTTVDNVFYRGIITNRPSIRTSLDLANSVAKTGNIKLSLINIKYKNDDLSAELFLGTRTYLNREVRVFSQLNQNTTLSNCMEIYRGRLIDVSHDTDSISLSIVEQRPWDFIDIPNAKTTAALKYVPVVYGDYTKNTVSPNLVYSGVYHKSQLTSMAYHPVPFNRVSGNKVYYLHSNSDGSTARMAWYTKQDDVFVPLLDSDTATSTEDGADSIGVFQGYRRIYATSPSAVEDSGAAVNASSPSVSTAIANETYMYDGNLLTYSTWSVAAWHVSSAGDGQPVYWVGKLFKFDKPDGLGKDVYGVEILPSGATVTLNEELNNSETGVDVSDASTLGAGDAIKINDEIMHITSISSNTLTVRRAQDGTTAATASTGTVIQSNYRASTFYMKYTINTLSASGSESVSIGWFPSGRSELTDLGGGFTSTGSVNAVQRVPEFSDSIRLRMWQSDQGTSNVATVYFYEVRYLLKCASELGDIEDVLYSAADGLTASYSGGSGTITTGHAAHRDLLKRFTGWDEADGDIYNWGSNLNINSARSAWVIRYWLLEPVSLEKVLHKLQKEFGFIFKYRPDGSGSYWYVKDSYSSGDVTATLDMSDIDKLKISTTPYSELQTKIITSRDKHAATGEYMETRTHEDSTNNPRKTLNIKTNENIIQENLDANYNKPGNVNPGGGSVNDGYADYYMNIFGTIKKIISCDVVNKGKGYKLETGDIVQFSNTAGEMPVEPFNDNWADYYMITDLNRSAGKVKITCREVG